MSCPKCENAKTPFCGFCGSRIKTVIVCPWCKAANDTEYSFCSSCGKEINYISFQYTKKANTSDKKIIEVLKKNTQYNEKWINRFVLKFEFYNDCQCPCCGEISEVAGVKYRDLLGFWAGLGITVGEALIQQINEPNVEHDEVEEIVGQEIMSVCLVCGNIWCP